MFATQGASLHRRRRPYPQFALSLRETSMGRAPAVSMGTLVVSRLIPPRITLERRQFVRTFHPSDAFGDLNVNPGRDGVRVVIGRALDVDDPGYHFGIRVEEAGATIGTEMSPALFRGLVNLRRAPCHLDCVEPVHRPADHRCADSPCNDRARALSPRRLLR